MSALIIYLLSCKVLLIEIKGNITIKSDDIKEYLKKYGIYHFADNKINSDYISQQLMASYDSSSWVGVDVKGSKVTVEIVERDGTPNVYNPNIAYNIVASNDGVISDFYLADNLSRANDILIFI